MTMFTHPDVLTLGVRDGWADPETDPTRIDWPARQAAAAIWFDVVDGRPVNPSAPTGIRYGRNGLGHWGEALAADAIVTATTADGQRWLLMAERGDSHGWALPGGMVEPGEDRVDAAVRELLRRIPGLRRNVPFCEPTREPALSRDFGPLSFSQPVLTQECRCGVLRNVCASIPAWLMQRTAIPGPVTPTMSSGTRARGVRRRPARRAGPGPGR